MSYDADMIEEPQYRQLQEDIRYCNSLGELENRVQRIMAPTGFGSNSLADTQDDSEPVGLDYHEMAECLEETDRKFFEQEIQLLYQAHRQREIIEAGAVPVRAPVANPWEMFM